MFDYATESLRRLPNADVYDLIIVARFDIIFKVSLADALLARFGTLCPQRVVVDCLNGIDGAYDMIARNKLPLGRPAPRVTDSLHVVPRALLPTFRSVWFCSHECFAQLAAYHNGTPAPSELHASPPSKRRPSGCSLVQCLKDFLW